MLLLGTCWQPGGQPTVTTLAPVLQGEKLPAKGGGMLRVSLAPAPMTAAQTAQTARRLLTTVRVQYQPSGQVARKLAIDPRTLGKITGAASFAADSHSHKYTVNPMLTLGHALAYEATREVAACCVGKEYVQAGMTLTSLRLSALLPRVSSCQHDGTGVLMHACQFACK
jgi:hypothetical protein